VQGGAEDDGKAPVEGDRLRDAPGPQDVDLLGAVRLAEGDRAARLGGQEQDALRLRLGQQRLHGGAIADVQGAHDGAVALQAVELPAVGRRPVVGQRDGLSGAQCSLGGGCPEIAGAEDEQACHGQGP
jgi:hypothetical protein